MHQQMGRCLQLLLMLESVKFVWWMDPSDQDQIHLSTFSSLSQYLNFLFILISRYLSLRKMISLDFMAIFYVSEHYVET